MDDLSSRIARLSPQKQAQLVSQLSPLSFAQQRLWFLHQLEPDSPAYNLPTALRLTGSLDVAALARTLSEIVRRHEVLRTTFITVKGKSYQAISPPRPVPMPLVDLSELPGAQQHACVKQLAVGEARQSFDLVRGPLLRIILLRLDKKKHVVLLTIHHIVTDGWSMDIFVREVSAIYQAFSKGQPSPLPELPIQYADFARWQREWLQGEILAAQFSYWKKQLDNAPPFLEIPTDYPRPAVQTYHGASQSLVLPASLGQALKQLSRQEKVTLFITLLAAFKVLLCRYTGQEDMVVGSPIAGRNRFEIENLVGFFVNTLVLRTRLSGNPRFREILARVEEVALGAYEHQDLPFEGLVEELQPERDRSRSPLFQVMFILQNNPGSVLKLPHLELGIIKVSSGTTKFDLLLSINERNSHMRVTMRYRTDLFGPAFIERILEHYRVLLEGIAANPDQRLSDLPLLMDKERHQQLVEWNNTRADYPHNLGIHRLFEARIRETPGAVAVVYEDQRLTYSELDTQASQLAHDLRKHGVGSDVLVGICLNRSLEMVVGILGILKAGGAFIPLSPDLPRDRLNLMLVDSQPRIILTQQRLRDRFHPNKAAFVCLDSDGEVITRESVTYFIGRETSGDLAYIIYTSGSTGRPKGVMISHRAVCNHLYWMQVTFPLNGTDRVLQQTPLSFDNSIWEIFTPLLTGAQAIMARPGGHRDSSYLTGVIVRQQVTILKLVPSLLKMLIEDKTFKNCTSLRRVFCGGEAVPAKLREQFFNGSPAQLYTLYGQTETAIDVTYRQNKREDQGEIVSIGRPIANTQIYILDHHLQPVPIGVPGQLHISGMNLARGYLNNPELTAKRFVLAHSSWLIADRKVMKRAVKFPMSFELSAMSYIYKTGDLARYHPDGNIEFLGRNDNQVKIRGFRIEPGEIESLLNRHPAVQETVVLPYEDQSTEKRLLAYVVSNQKPGPKISELHGFLMEKLPDYMVPWNFVIMDELPLMPNGKLDRRPLPVPHQTRPPLEEAFIAPRNPVEEVLADIWAEVLSIQQVGIHDNFFRLGGHSLLATQVISRVNEAFQVELPLQCLFDEPTIAGLAGGLEINQQANQDASALSIPHVSRDNRIPLSFSQERLWFLDQLEPGNSVYNLSSAFYLSGALDVAALEWSLKKVVHRHETLRTTFSVVDGQPFQVITPDPDLMLPQVNIQGLPGTHREVEVQRLAAQETRRSFDLNRGPLFRATLLCLDRRTHILLLTMHHIISDGWSLGILHRELSVLYAAISSGNPSPLPQLPVQYADFAVWQRQRLQGKTLEDQLSYWQQSLQQAPTMLELPTDYARPPMQTYRGERQSLLLSRSLVEALEKLGSQEDVTMFMTLLTAFKILLYRYTGQEDIVVGAPIAGRNRKEIEGLIGFFLNSLVLRSNLSGSPTFRELLGQVRQVTLGAYAHQELPFEKLLEELQPQRSLGHTPLFQVFFNMLILPNDPATLHDLIVKPLGRPGVQSKFDLTLYVRENNRQLRIQCVYNPDLFTQDRIAEMLQQYRFLLQQIVKTPDESIDRFSLVTSTAAHHLPDPTEPLDDDWKGSLQRQFSRQALRFPHHPAVIDSHDSWTYQELETRSNQLAYALAGSGIRHQDVVAIYGYRSASLVWALLGILKAGAAFMILDPAYPVSRLMGYLQAAKPQGWIRIEAAGPCPDQLEATITTLPCLFRLTLPTRTEAEACGLLADYPTDPPGIVVGPDHLACVAFTSGSTGLPKGILGRHGPLTHFLPWQTNTFELTASDRFSMLSGLSHDPLQREIFTPLWVGATICIPPPDGIGAPGFLAHWLVQENITFIHLTPAMGQLLEETASNGCPLPSLRYAFFVGDRLSRRTVARLRRLNSRVNCINSYGSTETQRAVGYYIIPPEQDREQLQPEAKAIFPVGCGMPGAQLLVLRRDRQAAGVGELGEIYVRSPHLARGYLDDDALTTASFLTNPFTGREHDRLYRTGDLGRYLPNGDVEFAGRVDRQVKIRGFRIEPGEIEAVLNQHPAVQEAVIIAQADGPDPDPVSRIMEKRLIAYVVPNRESTPTVTQLHRFLTEKLPAYMVPAVFMMLEALPLTPNGKVNLQALPLPEQTRPRLEETFMAPRSPLEKTLAGIWAQVLKLDRVGINDNFFQLGGHSLLATQVISRIRHRCRVELPLRSIFEKPTVQGLAAIIEQNQKLHQSPSIKPKRRVSIDQIFSEIRKNV
jgi:amino acid adenylation domain-containing protein